MALFPGQQGDEPTTLFVRRHWLVMASHALLFAILALLPIGARWLIDRASAITFADPTTLTATLLTLAAYLYWLFIWLFFFAGWVDYYLDYWVITDRRIVSVELEGLFARTVSELHLSRVQDATSEVKGILPTFFRFGNVFVQTAGEEDRFLFEQIPNPDAVVALVMELHGKVGPSRQNGVTASAGSTTSTKSIPTSVGQS